VISLSPERFPILFLVFNLIFYLPFTVRKCVKTTERAFYRSMCRKPPMKGFLSISSLLILHGCHQHVKFTIKITNTLEICLWSHHVRAVIMHCSSAMHLYISQTDVFRRRKSAHQSEPGSVLVIIRSHDMCLRFWGLFLLHCQQGKMSKPC
jgi:hypothetical protein